MERLIVSSLLYVLLCCCCARSVSSVSNAEFQIIVKRLEILENKDKTNQEIIGDLQEQVQTQSTVIEHLQQELIGNSVTITSLTNTVKTLNEQVLALTERVSILEEESHQPGQEFNYILDHPNDAVNEVEPANAPDGGHIGYHPEATSRDQRKSGAPFKRLIVDPEAPVAFHAVISVGDIDHEGHYQNIVFDKILLNLGAGYHSQHGVFIAPTAGLYLFSTTIMSYVGAVSEFQVDIVKNGNVLGRVFTHGDNGRHDQSAMTVLVQLAVNDEVWIREKTGSRIFGAYFSSFDGLLLIPQ